MTAPRKQKETWMKALEILLRCEKVDRPTETIASGSIKGRILRE